MRRACILLFTLLLTGGVALADTLLMADGTTVQGELVGLDAFHLYFAPEGGGKKGVPLSQVRSISLDWEANPEPRVSHDEWLSAISKARLELANCRRAKQGTIVGGLLFIAGGYWLGSQGHGPFGDLIMGLGAVVTLLGVASPQPTCDQPLHRVEILTKIGLEHGWVY